MKSLSRILLFCLSATLCFGQAATGVGAPGVSASSVEGGGGGGDGTVTDVSGGNTATAVVTVTNGTTTPAITVDVIPTPSVTGNSLISGGSVSYVSGLNLTVSAGSYIIQGTNYTSPITNLTAATADPTNPRFDTVALNTSGVPVIITGTPSATPVVPQADPDTQLYLTSYLLAAGATVIPVTKADIYFENTEWTMTKSGVPINLASTSNPYSGTVDIEATAAVAGNSFTATKPAAGTFDPATYNTLFFYIRNKAAWANAKSITIQLLRSGVARGSPVTFKGNTFGFNSQTGFTAYQQIAIPTSAFAANGVTCDAIRFSVLGGGGSIGFYVDAITLQSGISPYETSTKLHWAGNYNAALAYNINDVVLSSNIQYVAIQAGVGHTPASSTDYWAPSTAAPGTGTVTSVSVTTANGVSGSVATSTTTPAITLTLGAITPTTVNGNTLTTGTSTYTGTAGQTYTMPATTATLFGTTTKSDTLQAANLITLSSSGTDTFVGTAGVTATAYTTGTLYTFVANTANTGAATMNLNTLGAKTIVKVAGGVTTTLADNDIRSGQVVQLQYDGTNFQIQSLLGNAASGGSPGGSDTYLQYNSSGSFAGTSDIVRSGSGQLYLLGSSVGRISLGSASGQPSLVDMYSNGNVYSGSMYGIGATNYLFTGTAIGDMMVAPTSAKSFWIAPNFGASINWKFSGSDGSLSTNTGTALFTSTITSSQTVGRLELKSTATNATAFDMYPNGTYSASINAIGAANGTFTGTAAGDLLLYATTGKNVWIVGDGAAGAGGTQAFKFDTTGRLTINNTTDASSTSTGVLVAQGGAAVAKKLYVGNTVYVSSGANAKAGTFTLSAGAATVNNTSITTNSVVRISLKTASGAITAAPYLTALTAATSFVVAGGAGDNSTYNYIIFEIN